MGRAAVKGKKNRDGKILSKFLSYLGGDDDDDDDMTEPGEGN